MSKVHDIIRDERVKRGLPSVYWSREMARLAQSQADYCASVGHMVHSDRYAFQGGENLATQSAGYFTPRAIVNCWLRSPGHRKYLLSPQVTKAGVGIAKRNGKTFVAWAFSDSPPFHHDCPGCHIRKPSNWQVPAFQLPPIDFGMFKLSYYSFRRIRLLRILVGVFGFWLVVLGIHGMYVSFSYVDAMLSAMNGTSDKLFFVLSVPNPLSQWVLWMTGQGLQSWFTPLGVGIMGLLLMSWTGFTDSVTRWLRKLRLW